MYGRLEDNFLGGLVTSNQKIVEKVISNCTYILCSKSRTERVCNQESTTSDDIEKIIEAMTTELSKCDKDFVVDYVKQWIKTQIKGQSIEDTKNKIKDMIDEKFPNFHDLVVVYHPWNGYEHHVTNADLTLYR